MRNRFVVGAGDSYAVDATGGANSVTLSTAQMPSHTHGDGSYTTSSVGNHTHTYIDQVNDGNGGYRWWKGGDNDCRGDNKQTEGSGSHNHDVTGTSGSAGSGNSHENRPPYYALCYIMKT